mmetsp:Transcript_7174/g.14668  ORF Transcript_7174/g.14668 Transcript_7174/m.14668 type:complete len:107 (+) Transcript_7174:1752-2072(+)
MVMVWIAYNAYGTSRSASVEYRTAPHSINTEIICETNDSVTNTKRIAPYAMISVAAIIMVVLKFCDTCYCFCCLAPQQQKLVPHSGTKKTARQTPLPSTPLHRFGR